MNGITISVIVPLVRKLGMLAIIDKEVRNAMDEFSASSKRDTPFISVIIPTHNRAIWLERCLKALEDQTFPGVQFEVIVVDDGSTDSTQKLVKTFQNKGRLNLKYLKQENRGPAAARNRGIRHAEGQIVCFIDDDSIAQQDYLEELANAFRHLPEKVGVVKGEVRALFENGEALPKLLEEHIYKAAGSWASNNIAYREEALEAVGGFDESFPVAAWEDIDLGVRVVDHGYKRAYWEKAVVLHPHEADMETFRRKCIINGIGLRFYLRKWWTTKLRRALGVFYEEIAKAGLVAILSGNFLLREKWKNTLKGLITVDVPIKTKNESRG